jgi:hypothetical protein
VGHEIARDSWSAAPGTASIEVAHAHPLRGECGKQLSVTEAAAGPFQHCDEGIIIHLPLLRELRQWTGDTGALHARPILA